MAMAVRKQPLRLKDMADMLSDGDKVRELCPFCAGGSTGEHSFAMERTGSTASYICYRASCGARGRVSYGGIASTVKPANVSEASKVKRFLGDSHKLTINYCQFFRNKFNIQPMLLHEYGVKITDDGRVLFPIIGPTGEVRGDNVRLYKELTPPKQNVYINKATIYIPDGEPILSWHRLRCSKPDMKIPNFFRGVLVVVEDQVSAIKASRMVDAVSLMGTNLDFKKIIEIATESGKYDIYSKIIILLDGDAYAQALKTYRRTRALLPGVGVKKLEKDVKDMSYVELLELLKGVVKDYDK